MSLTVGVNALSRSDVDDAVFFIVRHAVKPGMDAQYEQWLRRLMFKAAEFPGHLGVQVMKPPQGSNEFTIAVRFRSAHEARAWQESDIRKEIAREADKYLSKQEHFEMQSGIDFWFTPNTFAPPKWKQCLLTTVVIWPLSVLIPALISPLFERFGIRNIFTLHQAVIAFIIVAIATYWAMPWSTHLVHRWLYPKH